MGSVKQVYDLYGNRYRDFLLALLSYRVGKSLGTLHTQSLDAAKMYVNAYGGLALGPNEDVVLTHLGYLMKDGLVIEKRNKYYRLRNPRIDS